MKRTLTIVMVVAMVASLFVMGFAGTAAAQSVDNNTGGDGGDGGDAVAIQNNEQTNNAGQFAEANAYSYNSYKKSSSWAGASVVQIGETYQENVNVQTDNTAIAGDGGDGGDGVNITVDFGNNG